GRAVFHGQKSGTQGLGQLSVLRDKASTTVSGGFYTDLPDAIYSQGANYDGVFRLHWVNPDTTNASGTNWEIIYRAEAFQGPQDYYIGFRLDPDGTNVTPSQSVATGISKSQNLRWFIENGRALYYSSTSSAPAGGSTVWNQSANNINYTTGNVGIGTTNPLYSLTINTEDEDHLRFENGAEAGFIRLTDEGALDIWAHGSSEVTFRTGSSDGTETMRIDSSGNVGIGTTSPEVRLDVRGNMRIGLDQDITPDADSTAILKIDGNGYTGHISLDADAMWIGHNSPNRDLYITTDETPRVTVKGDNGNVGIGTMNPAGTLELSSTNTDTNLYMGGTPASGTREPWRVQAEGDYLHIGQSKSSFAKYMTFSGSNVGIGTATPAHNLHIATGTPAMKLEGSQPRIWLRETDQTDLNTLIRNNNGVFEIDTVNNSDAHVQNRFAINHGNGNVRINDFLGIGKNPDVYHLDIAAPGAPGSGLRVQTNNSTA
ncbi:MAG: hypothetical protein VXY53_07235, partial [Candidatus Thermoplasmatota archaeon]|nr:hypothetical protein [Candidatus Thermoplasmatota archaeon]